LFQDIQTSCRPPADALGAYIGKCGEPATEARA
jgi:hypothetical protein